jgi:DNA-binding transcriptional regulator LsrR (DeoR family)
VAGSTTTEVWGGETEDSDPVAELLAQGAGRRRIAAQLGISEHQARRLLAERRNGSADVHA